LPFWGDTKIFSRMSLSSSLTSFSVYWYNKHIIIFIEVHVQRSLNHIHAIDAYQSLHHNIDPHKVGSSPLTPNKKASHVFVILVLASSCFTTSNNWRQRLQ
jgi:hypothetical protein